MAIVEDLEQVTSGVFVGARQSEVIDQHQIGLGEVAQEFHVAAVGPDDGQVLEQPRQSHVAGGVAVAAGLVGQRTSDPGLADSSQASDICCISP